MPTFNDLVHAGPGASQAEHVLWRYEQQQRGYTEPLAGVATAAGDIEHGPWLLSPGGQFTWLTCSALRALSLCTSCNARSYCLPV